MNIRKGKYVPAKQLTEYNAELKDKLQQQKISQNTMSPEQSLQMKNFEKIQNDNDQMIKFIVAIQKYENLIKQKDDTIALLNEQLRENQKEKVELENIKNQVQKKLNEKSQEVEDKKQLIEQLENKLQESQQLQEKYDRINQDFIIAQKQFEELDINIQKLQQRNEELERQIALQNSKEQNSKPPKTDIKINKATKQQNQLLNESSIDQFIEQSNDFELETDDQNQHFRQDKNEQKRGKQDKSKQQSGKTHIQIPIETIQTISNNVNGIKSDLLKINIRLKQSLSKVSIVTLETKFTGLIKMLQQQRRKQNMQMNQLKNISLQNMSKQFPSSQQHGNPRYMQPTVSKLLKVNDKTQLKSETKVSPEEKQQQQIVVQPTVEKQVVSEDNKLLKQQNKTLQKQLQTLKTEVEDEHAKNQILTTQNQQQQIQIQQLQEQLQQKEEINQQLALSQRCSNQNDYEQKQNYQQQDLLNKYKDVTLNNQDLYKNGKAFLNIPEEMQKHFNLMYYQIFHIEEVNSFIIDQHQLILAYTGQAKQMISMTDYMFDDKYNPIVNQINNLGKIYQESSNILKRFEYIDVLIKHLVKNDNSISQISVDIDKHKAQFKNLTYNRLNKDFNSKNGSFSQDLSIDINMHNQSNIIKKMMDGFSKNIQSKQKEIMTKHLLIQQKLTLLEKQVLKYVKNQKQIKQNDINIAKINKEAARSQEAYKKAVKIM